MSTAMHDGYYEVVWPRSPRRLQKKQLAPRLDTLAGKTIALLWDYLFQGDKVFDALEEGLKARYSGVRFVGWREFGNTHGKDERQLIADLPRRFKELGVDAAISGMGC